jgi:hypothetical protein
MRLWTQQSLKVVEDVLQNGTAKWEPYYGVDTKLTPDEDQVDTILHGLYQVVTDAFEAKIGHRIESLWWTYGPPEARENLGFGDSELPLAILELEVPDEEVMYVNPAIWTLIYFGEEGFDDPEVHKRITEPEDNDAHNWGPPQYVFEHLKREYIIKVATRKEER